MLNFMYHGEVNVAQEELNSFLSVAEDLEVKGLTQNNSSDSSQQKSTQEPTSNKKSVFEPRSFPPPSHTKHQPPTAVTTQSDPLYQVQPQDEIQEIPPPAVVKTEPLQVPVSRVEEGMEVANMDQNYDIEGFNNYEVYDDQGYYQDDGTYGYEEVGAREQNKGWQFVIIVYCHMAGSFQPQHFFAAGCIFADFVIAVIVFSCNKNFIKIFGHIIWVLTHSDIKFVRKNQVYTYVKNYPKIQ